MSAEPTGMDGRLKSFYTSTGRLMTVHLDILYACDLDCYHCYLDNKKRQKAAAEAEGRVFRDKPWQERGAKKDQAPEEKHYALHFN